MKFLFVIILVVFVLPTKGVTQYISTHLTKYSYKGETYKRKDLGKLLEGSPQAMHYHKSAVKEYRKGVRFLQIASSKLIVSGVLLYLISIEGGHFNLLDNVQKGGFIASTLLLFTGYILGLSGLRHVYKSYQYNRAAVNHFNWEVQEKLNKETSFLNLGITQNGFGFVYLF